MRCLVVACLLLGIFAGGAAADPLDKPWFTATPAELLAAAKGAAPGDHDAVILREDVVITYDDAGRGERRTRLVFAIVAPSAVDGWGTLNLGWAPFYQDKPTIRGRVIAPDGTVAEFDLSLVHDAPAVNESPTVFSDRRDMTMPLPRLSVGAVIEEEFVIKDREPLLAAGEIDQVWLERGVNMTRKVVRVSWPKTRKVKVAMRGPAIASKLVTRTTGDRTVATLDVRNLTPYPDHVAGAPSDWQSSPSLVIATAPSWAAVAADYRALVEAKLTQGVTAPADARGATPRATVDKLLAWLHARVRYTGIELADSAIIPATPADTLARGFGDCKDKATLLVSLLRSAGIPADLVLLSTGPGRDVDPGFPGMGEFDHAIVRAMVDGKPVWIDATEDLLPAGQLPVRDQNRRTLIVAAGTKTLTPSPGSVAADNLVREVRTYHLVEEGKTKVTEVSEEHGVWSDNLRGFVRNNNHDEQKKSFTSYADTEYLGKLTSFSSGAVGDVGVPFRLTLELDEVGRVETGRDDTIAWIFPRDTFDKLPDTFTDDDAEIDRKVGERRVDYVWSWPQAYEIEHRFELPPGYSPPDLPARDVRPVGTMTLTTTRKRDGAGYVIVHRLDSGKLRITADELRATRTAARQLMTADADRVAFSLDAAALRNAGKLPEAIAECRRLIALHPKEALHHGQLAQIYLETGMGEAARREATLATTLEPKNGDAWMVLGWVLARDPFGRRLVDGSDPKGAEAALRKALTHSPNHVGAKDDLAWLLAHETNGRLSLDAKRHREAAKLLRELKTYQDSTAYDDRIVTSLTMAGDAKELTAFATVLPDGDLRREATLTAIALVDPAKAVTEAARIAPAGTVDALLGKTMGRLLVARHYDATRTLTSRMQLQPIARALFAALKPRFGVALPPSDPVTPYTQMFLRLLNVHVGAGPWSSATDRALVANQVPMDSTGFGADWPLAVTIDLGLASLQLVTTGDAKAGWRLQGSINGNTATAYVVLRKGRAFFVGGPSLTPGLGQEIVDAVSRRDLIAARAWMRRLFDEKNVDPNDVVTFLRGREAELESASAETLKLWGLLLLEDLAPSTQRDTIRRCAGSTDVEYRKVCLRNSARLAFDAGDVKLASELLGERYSIDPDHRGLTQIYLNTLIATGARDEATRVLSEALKRTPADDDLKLTQFRLASAESWAAAQPIAKAFADDPGASPHVLNDLAWSRAYHDPDAKTARVLMERAMAALSEPTPSMRNTYATILAADGEPYQAWKQVSTVLGAANPLSDSDRYVLGRVAESYGLRDDAIAHYRTVKREKVRLISPDAWDFAQKRLKALGVATP